MLKDTINPLFKKLDNNGNPIKLKVSDLPSDIKTFENNKWITLRDKFSENHEMEGAYIIVHGKDNDGKQMINGF